MFQCEFYAYKLVDSAYEAKPRALPEQYPEGLRFKDTMARIVLSSLGKGCMLFHSRVDEYNRECRFVAGQVRSPQACSSIMRCPWSSIMLSRFSVVDCHGHDFGVDA